MLYYNELYVSRQRNKEWRQYEEDIVGFLFLFDNKNETNQ